MVVSVVAAGYKGKDRQRSRQRLLSARDNECVSCTAREDERVYSKERRMGAQLWLVILENESLLQSKAQVASQLR